MQARRTLGLAALALATALMAAGAWTAREGLKRLADERRQTAGVQARLASARDLMPEVQKREQYHQQAVAVAEQAQRMGFDPAGWAQRRITRPNAAISRADAGDLLRQIGSGGKDRLFSADSFDLAVLTKGAGLFTPPAPDDQGFSLAINGTLYFPLAARP